MARLGLRLENVQGVSECHSTLARRLPNLCGFALVLLQISQPELGHGNHVRFETPANELASHPDSCEINPRWNVANEVCILCCLPILGGIGSRWFCLSLFHASSIQYQYQIVKRSCKYHRKSLIINSGEMAEWLKATV